MIPPRYPRPLRIRPGQQRDVTSSFTDLPGPVPCGQELPPLPAFSRHHPSAPTRQGRPIRQITGASLMAAIRQMQEARASDGARDSACRHGSAGTPDTDRAGQAAAVDQLVERVNAVIPDQRYRVSARLSVEREHDYSHEFNLFVNGVCPRHLR